MSIEGWNAEEHSVEPENNYDPIPAGTYTAVMIDGQWKTAASGHEYLNWTWKIQGGEYDGRLVWQRVQLKNPNTAQYAQMDLTAASKATGVTSVPAGDKIGECFHHIPVAIKVKLKPDNNGEMRNEIDGFGKGIMPLNKNQAAPASHTPQQAAQPAQTANGGTKTPPPWLNTSVNA